MFLLQHLPPDVFQLKLNVEGNFESHMVYSSPWRNPSFNIHWEQFPAQCNPLPFVCSTPTPLASSFSLHHYEPSSENLKRSWMRPYWGNEHSQLLKHSSHCFGVCLRDELSSQGFKINFMQNGVWTFKGGEGTEDQLVQQIKLEIMLTEYSLILYNAKNEDVNENILWRFLCTEWNT